MSWIPSIEREIGGNPATFTTQLSDKETRTEMWHPMCYNKKIALLGTYCVGPTTDEDDKDPNHDLPRLTFEVKREEKTAPVTIFLFDDEANSWPAFWKMLLANKTCDEMSQHAKATISEGPQQVASASGAQIHGYKNIRGRFPHHWHLVAVDCDRHECPQVQSANITYYHPHSNGKNDACREAGVGESVEALKNSMIEGMHALSMRNVLNVIGLSHFGVFVLYSVFAAMLLFSVLFLIWAIRSDTSRRFLYLNTLFITSMSTMAYLAMATGNGILVLRKVPQTHDYQASWRISDPLLAHKGTEAAPNPMYNKAYGDAPTYPIFWARHVSQFLTTPLILVDLFLVSGVSNNTRAFMLFSNAMMVLCWLAGSLITGAARWGFWVFGCVFAAGVLIPLVGVLPTSAARKGRASRRLYGRLMCITMLSGLIAPWAWVLVEGAHALPTDLAVLVYGILDVISQCVFGLVLLRKAPPALSTWGEEESHQQATRLNPNNSHGGQSMQVLDPNDDL